MFLLSKTDAIVDPSQFEIMKANFTITKTMIEDELKARNIYDRLTSPKKSIQIY